MGADCCQHASCIATGRLLDLELVHSLSTDISDVGQSDVALHVALHEGVAVLLLSCSRRRRHCQPPPGRGAFASKRGPGLRTGATAAAAKEALALAAKVSSSSQSAAACASLHGWKTMLHVLSMVSSKL